MESAFFRLSTRLARTYEQSTHPKLPPRLRQQSFVTSLDAGGMMVAVAKVAVCDQETTEEQYLVEGLYQLLSIK